MYFPPAPIFILRTFLVYLNGDLNPIKSHVQNADVITTIRNLVSAGQKSGVILFTGNSTGLPEGYTSGNVSYAQPEGTSAIYLEYKNLSITYYGYFTGSSTTPEWDKYVLNSDLGIIIKSSGTVAAVKGIKNAITNITLPAGHKYLVLGETHVSVTDPSSIISCQVDIQSGTVVSSAGPYVTRTTMNSGGGVVTWGYVETDTKCVYGISGYGYSSLTYNYTGSIIAIQLA